MRPDALGFFWRDVPIVKGTRVITRIMPDIPVTGWTAPRDYPNLAAAPFLSLDTETKDVNLLTHGPGWGRGDGHIVGVSVGVPERAWYFPIRHEARPEENLNPTHTLNWLRDTVVAHGKKPVIGANLLYDIGYVGDEGIYPQGPCYDVQFAEALLEEGGDVNLEHLGVKYLAQGKETSVMYQWLADFYGGKPDESQRKNIYRCPPSLVGPYAEQDAVLPSQILPYQWARLAAEGLVDIFEMETALIPLLIRMRKQGVCVNVGYAEEARDKLVDYVKGQTVELQHMVGHDVNVDANESLQKAFRTLNLVIPTHFKTGKPSFTKDTLAGVEHPIGKMVLDIRKNDKVRSSFIESAILEKHKDGILHCQFHPLRGDDSGTRSGRFAASNPNLQQVPSRDEVLAPIVRKCFVPRPGGRRWRRYDYNQIEYRFNAHYAVGPGSNELRARYNADPKTDYHIDTQNMLTRYTGIQIPRKPVKNFNFGMTFGMGKAKMVRTTTTELRKMGGTFSLDGAALYNAYHEALPFSKETLQHFSKLAANVGFVTTILGRRSRFNLFEPEQWNDDGEEKSPALPYGAAVARYGRVRRAYTHKALNRVLQGSAADMMKVALLTCWKSGVFDYTGVPGLTVHDELDFSDPLEEDDPAWQYIQHTMENCIKLRIPVLAALELGANWGECH